MTLYDTGLCKTWLAVIWLCSQDNQSSLHFESSVLCQWAIERSLDPVLQQNKYFITMQGIDGSASSVTMVIESPRTLWWYLLTELFSLFSASGSGQSQWMTWSVGAFTFPENHRTKNQVSLSGQAESLRKSQWSCEFMSFDELFLKTEVEHEV